MKEIHIVGAGTYGEVMYELAEECGYHVAGFYDEDENKIGKYVFDVQVVGKLSELKDEEIFGKKFIVAIGDNEIRCNIMTEILNKGGDVPTLIHPTAKISKSANIGRGVYIQMGAVIWTKVVIGDFSIISPNTVIAHHTKIGKACLISTLCAIGASVSIGDYTMFGFASVAITGIRQVGKNVVLGANTTVTKDVGDNVLMVGSPARVIKDRKAIKE